MATLNNTNINDAGFIKIPTATTFGRLANPQTGNMYFDTTYAGLGNPPDPIYFNDATLGWTNLLNGQLVNGLYYNEGSTAPTTYWNNATTRTMDNFGELGLCTGHGWTTGPAEYIFTLPGLAYHTSIRYRIAMHLVDSLDTETSYVDLTNSAGTYDRFFTWTKAYNAAPSLSFSKTGASATWNGNKTYTYSPWPGTPINEGYYIFDSGRYEHTASSFSARHYMGADQDVSDEAMYITHVQLYLYNV
jgi:hypothetical protein